VAELQRHRSAAKKAMGVWMLLVVVTCAPSQALVVGTDTPLDEPVMSGVGGRTVLVQELTATWCPSCAEIDPELVRVADSHGSRIALVALHPSDGEDAFQPAASQHRIERLKLTHNDAIGSTPTFVVEDGQPRIGYEAWADVQRDILDAEVQRQSVSELEFQVVSTNAGLEASVVLAHPVAHENTQLTFLVLEHQKAMPEGAVNPGEATRDRVVVGAASCDLMTNTVTQSHGSINASTVTGCGEDFSVVFPSSDSWSVVLIHEHTEAALENGSSPESLGVVELAYRDRAVVEDEAGLSFIILGAVVVLAVAAIVPKK
jgi:thiol-disulfide isomerase/thioredoxin